jgi:hypothetical protein
VVGGLLGGCLVKHEVTEGLADGVVELVEDSESLVGDWLIGVDDDDPVMPGPMR